MIRVDGRDVAVARARSVLRLDPDGRPRCHDARAVVLAIEGLIETGDREAIEELVVAGFLRGSPERYEEHVAPHLRALPGGRFAMGTDPAQAEHFCGETPRHDVRLSPFALSAVPVTNGLYGLLDPDRPEAGERHPVAGVTWFDASLFAAWMGCRLPTEAEWEYACGAGSAGQWCCADEGQLPRFAWYSENSRSEMREVGTREPNAFGLFDMHGTVWEWCRDEYDQGFYGRSGEIDPVNEAAGFGGTSMPDRVTRGGSYLSLAEMCRNRYRFHERPDFWAGDLGFRLAGLAGQDLENGRRP